MTKHPGSSDSIPDLATLEDRLSEPTAGAVETMSKLDGDLLVLGAAGKMGPTLTRMARRAVDAAGGRQKVIAASRFSDPAVRGRLEDWGVPTISCDLLDADKLAGLPDVPNVIFMAGMKFGAAANASTTWAMNTYLPATVAQKYKHSRIVAFSTGNVYGLSPVTLGGSRESDLPAPVGEYAMSCLGRERIFEHFSRVHGTKVSLLRLNYACELRYGVLVDLATKVWDGRVIDLSMGNFNAIWQGDANAAALQTFDAVESPPRVLNIAGPELLSVRRVCEQFAVLFDKPVAFEGRESPDALLSNGQLLNQLCGYPAIPVEKLMLWIADWIAKGGTTAGKPTHFEARDGKF